MREVKREVRKFESRYIKNRSSINFDVFKYKFSLYKTLLNSAKTAFYREKFGKRDNIKFFQLVKKLSSNDRVRLLPDYNSKQDLANCFSSYFANKVDSLRQELDVPHLLDYAEISIDVCPSCLGEFKSLSLVEVKELLKESKTKSCDMDPIPTSI